MIKVYEIAHLLSKRTPFLSKLHHILTTSMIIFLYRNVFLRILIINIFLCNTKFFLYAKFDRKSVSIPTGFTVNLETLHGFIAVECILDRTSQHMVNTWMTIS